MVRYCIDNYRSGDAQPKDETRTFHETTLIIENSPLPNVSVQGVGSSPQSTSYLAPWLNGIMVSSMRWSWMQPRYSFSHREYTLTKDSYCSCAPNRLGWIRQSCSFLHIGHSSRFRTRLAQTCGTVSHTCSTFICHQAWCCLSLAVTILESSHFHLESSLILHWYI